MQASRALAEILARGFQRSRYFMNEVQCQLWCKFGQFLAQLVHKGDRVTRNYTGCRG